MRLYIDSSALVKLIVTESESQELRSFLSQVSDLISSNIARLEVARFRSIYLDSHSIRSLEDRLSYISMTNSLVSLSIALGLSRITRALDAIHLASAFWMRNEIVGIITYDKKMSSAAAKLGLPTFSPGLS